jgi:hypothetical protein
MLQTLCFWRQCLSMDLTQTCDSVSASQVLGLQVCMHHQAWLPNIF